MNLVLLFEEDFIHGTTRARLQGRRLKHISEVHRTRVGDVLRVGLLGGRIGTGTVISMNSTVLEIDVVLDSPPPPSLPATIVLALPRPKVLKRLLISATSMGVKRIFLINAWRVEKSFWKSPALEREKIQEHLVLGLEQARDTILPDVLLRPYFKPFVEDELPEIIRETLAIVAHPAGPKPCPRDAGLPVTLAVGPEGGFIPYEIELLTSIGFASVHLGERILRTETAVPALLSRLF